MKKFLESFFFLKKKPTVIKNNSESKPENKNFESFWEKRFNSLSHFEKKRFNSLSHIREKEVQFFESCSRRRVQFFESCWEEGFKRVEFPEWVIFVKRHQFLDFQQSSILRVIFLTRFNSQNLNFLQKNQFFGSLFPKKDHYSLSHVFSEKVLFFESYSENGLISFDSSWKEMFNFYESCFSKKGSILWVMW